jgi:hypothetical protein
MFAELVRETRELLENNGHLSHIEIDIKIDDIAPGCENCLIRGDFCSQCGLLMEGSVSYCPECGSLTPQTFSVSSKIRCPNC